MKNFKIVSILIVSCLFFSNLGLSQSTLESEKLIKNKIEVINFHSTNRCMTCNAIEANTKHTLETFFSDEVKQGIIIQKTLNIDVAENEKIAETFEASGTSLFLNVIIDNNETQIDLTNFAFTKGRDKEEFTKGLKKKIEKQLEKM